MCRLATALLALVLAGPGGMPAAQAQVNPFEPVLMVDGAPVTAFDFFQRRQFLRALGVQGDIDAQVEAALIDERLQLAEAARLGISVPEQDLRAGMEEFAARTNLSVDAFIEAIGQSGVAPETFIAFVRAGLAWRLVVRARFGSVVSAVTEAEVDRALSVQAQRAVTRADLSEIVLPDRAEALANELLASIDGPEAFAAAARAHSIAPSAERGGRIAPVPLSYLAPAFAQQISAGPPERMLPPSRGAEGIVLYFLHGTDSFGSVTPAITEVDYVLLAPAPDAEARAALGDCVTLYARAGDQTLLRLTTTEAEVPPGHARALARIDAGESALIEEGPDAGALIVLCARRLVSGLAFGDGETAIGTQGERLRAGVRESLRGARLAALAEHYLRDLRADAQITRP
jgi:peptidyl-prolyl cis-trans isomerase SurA